MMKGETALSILRRLIDASPGTLTAPMAEAILQLSFSEGDQRRMTELASRSNTGTLIPAEADEYDGYIAAADLLSLWKSKARMSLTKHSSAA